MDRSRRAGRRCTTGDVRMHLLAAAAVTALLLAEAPAARAHPVSQHSPVRWARGDYPVAVPTRGVPDGPLAANGDFGVTVGGIVVRLPEQHPSR